MDGKSKWVFYVKLTKKPLKKVLMNRLSFTERA